MGVDTVKLSYPLSKLTDQPTSYIDCQPWQYVRVRRNDGTYSDWREYGGWAVGNNYGTTGPVWWTERVHADGTRVIIKGVGKEGTLLWEQSVPKFLGICGAAHPDDVRVVDRHIRRLLPGLPVPNVRRCDVTEDIEDEDGSLRRAALGWNPHARSRYVQARYAEDETVWQHNKTRGVRVYDKFAESGEEWAYGLTRVEYQIRGAWLERLGLDRLNVDFAKNCQNAIMPLVAELETRRAAPDAAGTTQCGVGPHV